MPLQLMRYQSESLLTGNDERRGLELWPNGYTSNELRSIYVAVPSSLQRVRNLREADERWYRSQT